jgi:hypothetical protein
VIGRFRSKGMGIGVWAAAMARRRALPWRRLAGVGQTWPSGLHLGRGQALEMEHNAVNTSGRSRRLAKAQASRATARVARGSGHRRRAAFQELGRVLSYDN